MTKGTSSARANGTGSRIPDALVRVLKTAKSFAIVGHMKPDADTVGSSLAIASAIRRLGPRPRRVVLANASLIPPQLRFMPDWQRLIAPAKRSDLKGLDCAIYLECATPERAGGIAHPNDFRVTVNIDHHKTARNFAAVNWINARASSNAEQVYLLLKKLGLSPDRREAVWIYAGIVSDTGRFQYAMTSPQTHLIAADLLSKGIEHTRIMERLFTIKSVEHLKLLSRALANVE